MTHTFCVEGHGGIAAHRAILPAIYTGGHYICRDSQRNILAQSPNNPHTGTTFIYHMPGRDWQVEEVRRMKREGNRVIVDVDDYLPGVASSTDHGYAHTFKDVHFQNIENGIKAAGELSVSVPWLGKQYGHLVDHVWHTPNGIDMDRFFQHRWDESKPPRIVWSGGTGHMEALQNVLPAIVDAMDANPATEFWIMGERPTFGVPDGYEKRTRFFPWTSRSEYPKALAMCNIALAPDRATDFYRGKSALRFYEAATTGIPTVGGTTTYSSIEHGSDGFLCESPAEWSDALVRLVTSFELRKRMGMAAYDRAKREFCMMHRALNWDRMTVGAAVSV